MIYSNTSLIMVLLATTIAALFVPKYPVITSRDRTLAPEDLDRWDEEVIPVTVDAEEARKVALYNALEGWDHCSFLHSAYAHAS
ncbi:hypothetical protein BKA64DRAFT_759361 [Cadophora sp. MPI-SDFR-AT-0126]|nr:hypothetical protein BKA64DRAFT_759361 [Leotiomycetes sp. MPI-SDFR-AT-0126]